MLRRRAHVALVYLLVAACSGGPSQAHYQTHTLSSGQQIKVLGVTRMTFPQSGPALMLKYQTDLDISDTAALHAEAGRVWADFRAEAERAGVGGAILSATSPPVGGMVSHSKGYNFVYLKQADGGWQEARK
jgi:hypothetical protein